jgi:hypothetical protein
LLYAAARIFLGKAPGPSRLNFYSNGFALLIKSPLSLPNNFPARLEAAVKNH